MSQIRDYIRNQTETQTLVQIKPNDGSYGFLQLEESVYKNGFSDLLLYADSGGVTSLVLNTDYELSPSDSDWTSDEAGFSNITVYPQFRITNVTYQNVDIWATFTNFGVYTSADANFDMVGGSETVTTSPTLVVPFGYTRYRFNFDSSSGDITPTMPNGAFDGQQVILNEVGGGNVAYITGAIETALADSNESYTWDADNSKWLPEVPRMVRASFALSTTTGLEDEETIPISTVFNDTHEMVATSGVTIPVDGVYSFDGNLATVSAPSDFTFTIDAQIDDDGIDAARGFDTVFSGLAVSGKNTRGRIGTSLQLYKGEVITFRVKASNYGSTDYFNFCQISMTRMGNS